MRTALHPRPLAILAIASAADGGAPPLSRHDVRSRGPVSTMRVPSRRATSMGPPALPARAYNKSAPKSAR